MKSLSGALQNAVPEATLSSRNTKADKITWRALRCFTRHGYVTGQRDWLPMSERLEGRHVLLTGANSGIGLATAIDLAAAGAELTLVVRSQKKADETAATILVETGRSDISFELADLSLMSHTEALISRLIAANRKVDVLPTTRAHSSTTTSITAKDWSRAMHYYFSLHGGLLRV